MFTVVKIFSCYFIQRDTFHLMLFKPQQYALFDPKIKDSVLHIRWEPAAENILHREHVNVIYIKVFV